jgi:hypothetical protein
LPDNNLGLGYVKKNSYEKDYQKENKKITINLPFHGSTPLSKTCPGQISFNLLMDLSLRLFKGKNTNFFIRKIP